MSRARAAAGAAPLALLALLGGCAAPGVPAGLLRPGAEAAGCGALAGSTVDAAAIGLPSGPARVDSASWVAATPMGLAARGPSPAATITPAQPPHCRVLGQIAPLGAATAPSRFQLNLPQHWNGRALQYGGVGLGGVLISGTALLPSAPFDRPSPLAQGFATFGTDGGHGPGGGRPLQAFALDDEALENFAHASYKKLRDVAGVLLRLAYGRGPERSYFAGSAEGGREALAMAQRYPADYDGVFARVPLVAWTAWQHTAARDALALQGTAWIRPRQVQRVHDAVLAACDALDGLADGIVSDPTGCRQRLDLQPLRCSAPAAGEDCLTEPQLHAIRQLHAGLELPFALAHDVHRYPGRGPGGEAAPAAGPSGGWMAWWTGSVPTAVPPQPGNGIAWTLAAGTIAHFFARDPALDLRRYRIEDHAERVRAVSALMDATDPDLSAFRARGGKLILLEHGADYGRSPWATVQYLRSVQARLGAAATDDFVRLYLAPGVDHLGSGAPAVVDVLPALVDWVEQGRAPGTLTLAEQQSRPPFAVTRMRPLCRWPARPRYRGGDPQSAASFDCTT